MTSVCSKHSQCFHHSLTAALFHASNFKSRQLDDIMSRTANPAIGLQVLRFADSTHVSALNHGICVGLGLGKLRFERCWGQSKASPLQVVSLALLEILRFNCLPYLNSLLGKHTHSNWFTKLQPIFWYLDKETTYLREVRSVSNFCCHRNAYRSEAYELNSRSGECGLLSLYDYWQSYIVANFNFFAQVLGKKRHRHAIELQMRRRPISTFGHMQRYCKFLQFHLNVTFYHFQSFFYNSVYILSHPAGFTPATS